MTDRRKVVARRVSSRFAVVGIGLAVLGLSAATAGWSNAAKRLLPRAPAALHVTASSRTSLSLSWRASADRALAGYYVYRNGHRIASVNRRTTIYTFRGLRCGTSYVVGLAAHDAKGGGSRRSTVIDATDGCAPPPPSGGTLIVNGSNDFDFTDPSITWSTRSWQLEYATGLKLYNYPDKPAPEGSTLMHEAAAGFPLISDGGRTYTITVKPGFKFSDGTPVTAANFAFAINRALQKAMQTPAIEFMGGIVGANAVYSGKAFTASGVQVHGDKLVIKLEQPDGGFTAKLATPFYQAIKTDMPIDPQGVSVYPSAGPYYIASRQIGSRVTLKRNPYYTGSRPANADTIQINVGITAAQSLEQVKSGEADYDMTGVPASANADLGAAYGVNTPDGQYHVTPLNTLWYIALNTSRAPFNNVNLRKAANDAADRPAMNAAQGVYAATPTDQILPRDIPGFRDAHIYPLDGPDYAKARSLAGDSCGTVKLWSFRSGFGPAWANIFKSNLEQIGCTVQVTLLDRANIAYDAGTRGADFDAIVTGWGQVEGDPFDFLDVLLNGNHIEDHSNVNVAYFNNPKINAKLERANPLTGAARYKTYGKLDVEIMANDAPWVPVDNPNALEFNSARVRGYVLQPSIGKADLNTFFVK
jgi:ABC-type oligopeptide transport system substrate-binding subunit